MFRNTILLALAASGSLVSACRQIHCDAVLVCATDKNNANYLLAELMPTGLVGRDGTSFVSGFNTQYPCTTDSGASGNYWASQDWVIWRAHDGVVNWASWSGEAEGQVSAKQCHNEQNVSC